MSASTHRDVMLYVTVYDDHLNHILPEKSVLMPKYSVADDLRSYPYFRLPDLREGKIPGVDKVTPPPELEGWDYWVCDWTPADFSTMNVVPEFLADDEYIEQWPDIWFMGKLFVNAKAMDALQRYAPDTGIFVPVRIFSSRTGEPLDVERWMVVMRHWLDIDDGERLPEPNTDFSVSWYPNHLFRVLQSDLNAVRAVRKLRVFGGPVPSTYSRSIYSPDVFRNLVADGLTGLREKSPRKSPISRNFREVIGHACFGALQN